MYKIPAAIFAGGKSSRMGQDKALLPFGKYTTLSEFQYQKLKPLFSEVYLCAKENKFSFACEVIKDKYTESSPLVGMVSVLETLKVDAIFILSVDAPLVDKPIIDALYNCYIQSPDSDAIVAKSPHGLEPLCGIYTRHMLTLAKKYLAQDNHRLSLLLKESSVEVVTFNTSKPFTNLNTFEEYQAISS